MKKSLFLFLIFFLGCFPLFSARAEDLSLKIEASPDQNSVKSGMMFLVHVAVENTSSDTSKEFWSNSCSYEKHWVTDNAAVFIQSWTCEENTLEQVTLEPGSSYEKNVILYIPKKDKTEPVSFRLGFKRMSEDGDVAEPLWSDPITIHVIVPDDMKETAPETDADVALQSPESDAAAPEGSAVDKAKDQEPESAAPAVAAAEKVQEPEPAGQAANQPLVFQDPAVPIKVGPGQNFSISLGSNPSTGFRWKMTLPAGDKTVMFLGSEHVASQEVMPGVPGNELFKFKALTRGETKAAFVYERPWETKTAPTRKIFTIVVQEN